MSIWKEKKLGDLIRIKHGYAFDGEYITTFDNGIVLVTPGNFNIGGGFKFYDKKFYTGIIPEEYILKHGSLIVTMTDLSKNADTLGYAALVPNDNRTYLHNQRIGLVSICSNEIYPNYLYWLLRTPQYQRRIANTCNGTNVKHTSPERIYKYKFFLPNFSTQKGISNILSTYDELIENNNHRIVLLEKVAQELYNEWFVRFRFPDHADVKYENGLPAGWKIKRLFEYGRIETGKTPSTENQENYGGEIMFVKTPDMHGNMFITQTDEKLTERGHQTQPSKLLPANSIMVSCIGTAGVVSINAKQAHTNQQINSIILKDLSYLEWLYFACKSLKSTIELFGATGATMTNLSKSKFENLKVIDPGKNLVMSFHDIVKDFFSEIESLLYQNSNLVKQRDLLLPRLMSGKLEV